jgi:hypothetical protein
MAMFLMLFLLVLAVLANLVHGTTGVGGAMGGGRPDTWIITLLLLGSALMIAGMAVRRRVDGIFIDRDNRISLSRFQLILWTVLLVSALMTAGLTNALSPDDLTPLQIEIPPQIWALLGLGAFTAVAAPAIKDAKRSPGGGALAAAPGTAAGTAADPAAAPARLEAEQGLNKIPFFDGRVLVKSDPTDARWIDLILGEYEGSAHVDISKLQQLAFTVLLVSIYGMAIWTRLLGTAHVDHFPPLDSGFLALLGLSHAAYLADKQIGST